MIYFIKSESGHVKIGFTDHNIEQRLIALQCGNPYRLSILGTIDGDREQEKLIQQKFKKKRCNGEWFIFDDEVREFIDNLHDLEEPEVKSLVESNKKHYNKIEFRMQRSFVENFNLSDYLNHKKITQSKLAQDMGCSRQFIHNLILGKKTPGLELAVKIEEWSNGDVHPSVFFEEK